jgi:hypothetical protein
MATKRTVFDFYRDQSTVQYDNKVSMMLFPHEQQEEEDEDWLDEVEVGNKLGGGGGGVLRWLINRLQYSRNKYHDRTAGDPFQFDAKVCPRVMFQTFFFENCWPSI